MQHQLASREVGLGIVNLGNTCYISAVLQVLAHAPELYIAMDYQSHGPTCPIRSSSFRKGNHVPKEESSSEAPQSFCILCELEQHLSRAHPSSITTSLDYSPTTTPIENASPQPSLTPIEALSPTSFVKGFMTHVAPWFRIGLQEDSHEFLRLLIDAMQSSCVQSRTKIEPHDQRCQYNLESSNETPYPYTYSYDENIEYPFRLFRGSIESTVTCSFCQSISRTLDPMEDLGLEVTFTSISSPIKKNIKSQKQAHHRLLGDVTSSLNRFIDTERLDTGYICETCGKSGQATKQSKLASIPPILTLHLKRFRYGTKTISSLNPVPSTNTGPVHSLNSTNRQNANTSTTTTTTTSSSSGSGKIEGFIPFEQVLDLRPYLTHTQSQKSTFCRLFAIIVHIGKNSHSGHYISYVRNMNKNEWYRMDDSKVTKVTKEEVDAAEAYMLFYRVVEHPVVNEWKRKSDARSKEKTTQSTNTTKESSSSELDESVRIKLGDEQSTSDDHHLVDWKSYMESRERKKPKYKSLDTWSDANTPIVQDLSQVASMVAHQITDGMLRNEYMGYLKSMAAEHNLKQQSPKDYNIDVSLHDMANSCFWEHTRHALYDLFAEMKRSAEIREEDGTGFNHTESNISKPPLYYNGTSAVEESTKNHMMASYIEEENDEIQLDEDDDVYLQMSSCYNSNDMLL